MYVAWALLFIFSIGSAVVVVIYGMQFENVKSLQWLFSSCVSFVQDVLITQPLKVLSFILAIALRRSMRLSKNTTFHHKM